jgi:hypothetical protein
MTPTASLLSQRRPFYGAGAGKRWFPVNSCSKSRCDPLLPAPFSGTLSYHALSCSLVFTCPSLIAVASRFKVLVANGRGCEVAVKGSASLEEQFDPL